MGYRKLILLVVIAAVMLVASPQGHAADDVSVRAFTDRSSMTIGDKVKLTIEITSIGRTQIQMPVFTDNIIGDFEIRDHSAKIVKHFFGKRTTYDRYQITTFLTGKRVIPSLEIKYKPRSAKDWILKKTQAVSINVLSVLPEQMPQDIKDIRGPFRFFEMNWILVGAASVGLLILGAILVVIKKMRDRKPVRLPHETALEELEALRAQLASSGGVKEYFIGVSDCVRRYIERAFSLRAPEMTSEEFLNSLRDSTGLTIAHKELLNGFMSACDLVKFARYSPTGEEAENIYITAKNFINETREPFQNK